MTVFVWKYSYNVIGKNLVVFCLLSNLNIVADPGLGDIMDTSVFLLVCCQKRLNVLMLMDKIKKHNSFESKKCIVNMI